MMDFSTAQRISTAAHEGQVDKSGAPYIFHPQRIAERVANEFGVDHPAVAVAWLHDVLEDTDVTMSDLRVGGLDDAQAMALEALTHHHSETREAYIERIRLNELALIVKRADIADNSDPERLARLAPDTATRLHAKYARDLAQLASGVAAP
jgi:(p)ppGpp synthase/HD superfamily hydrolase